MEDVVVERVKHKITKKLPNSIILDNYYKVDKTEIEEDGINFDNLKEGDIIIEETHFTKNILLVKFKLK